MIDPEPVVESSPWLTVTQAAARAQVGAKAIYAAIAAGKLKAARLGVRRTLRIHVDWIDAWVLSAAVVVNPDAPGAALAYRRR